MEKKLVLARVAWCATLLVLLGVLATGVAAQKKGGGGTTPDLGDLFVLYRGADGVPILTPDSCQQPLAAPGLSLPAIRTIPACVPSSSTQSCVIPVDPVTCAIGPGYETYAQEVDFGRTNVIRSPVSVLQMQMNDVMVNLATADCITLDDVDMVAYVNQILGLTDETVTTFLPKKCIMVKQEVRGVVTLVRKCFLDYGDFAYSRVANFDALPFPAYIPASGPVPGWFEYLAVDDPTRPTFRDHALRLVDQQGVGSAGACTYGGRHGGSGIHPCRRQRRT